MSVGVRLLATDLDGTLLRRDDTVSDRTRAALRAAEDGGLLVAFVTGRPTRWLDDVIEETGHLGVAVGANGALVYDMRTEELLSAHYLSPELLRELTDELRAAFPGVRFAVEYGAGFAGEPEYVHDWEINPRLGRRGLPLPPPMTGTIEEIIAAPGVKLLAKDRDADADEFLRAASALLAGRASITHSSSFGLLEIAAPGISKATGLAELAAMHGIEAADVVAVGDMPNDVPMLEWAGRSYAVANAHPAARAAADAVIGRNDDDAVAVLIEDLLAGDPPSA
jgi:hypothetical protein